MAIIERPTPGNLVPAPAGVTPSASMGVFRRPVQTTGWREWLFTVDHKKLGLMYGVTGETRLSEIAVALAGPLEQGKETLALASILFIAVGFGFKVSAVPFQFWAPDTYEGSPVPVAAFLATASKAAGFAGLLQLMFVAFPAQWEFWTPIFAVLSILTMTIGNLVALQQRQAVRSGSRRRAEPFATAARLGPGASAGM